MDRALIALRSRWALPAIAVAVEIAIWTVGGLGTETFAPDRVAFGLGAAGFAAAVAVGLAFGAWGRLPRSLAALGAAALVVHLAFVDLPQAQPDTVTWLLHAGRFMRDPLATLATWPEVVWSGDEARFHRPLPVVPLVYGLVFAALGDGPFAAGLVMAAVAVALPFAVYALARAAGEEEAAPAAAWLALSTPFLQAQTGWILADLPFTLAICLAWVAILRARDGRGVALAALACALALGMKITAPLYLAGPVAARILGPRAAAALSLVGLLAIAVVSPPRLREPGTWLAAALVIGLHLRPSMWALSIEGLTRSGPGLLLSGLLVVVPTIALWAPVEHAARYALPLAPALCVGAAAALRHTPRVAPALVGSGLVLLMFGYRPLLVHHQAANVQIATRQAMVGAQAIEVWGDHPRTTFPPVAVAVMVDYYADVPVRMGGTLRLAPAGRKHRWWEHVDAPPWLAPGPADTILLSLHGATPDAFEQQIVASGSAPPEVGGDVAAYSASSLLWPTRVVWYKRAVAYGTPIE